MLHFHITGETVDDLHLTKRRPEWALASGVCQKPGVLGFQPASNTEQMVAEIGPVAWLQCRGSLTKKWEPFFLETLRFLRLVSTWKPVHIVIHSVTCSTLAAVCGTLLNEKPCDCGHCASLGFAYHRAHFLKVLAHRVDLCGGRSLCSVSIDLNRVDARHREFLRLRVRLAQTVDSLGPSSAFPDALPLLCCTSPLPCCSFDHQVGSCCP